MISQRIPGSRAHAAELPVADALPALREALARGRAAVLRAEPGAGKTTLVPVALLDEPWLAGRKIVMLEPRRLAARAAARRIAWLLGEEVGGVVGHRVRFDTRVGPRTRIEVVTEGVLTRMLLDDPALDAVGLVIFDEFHERNLHGDVGLALAMESRAVLRPDLALLVMSATLDGAAVSSHLGGAPCIETAGRVFPVETRYRPPRRGERLEDAVATVVREALAAEPGDVLVFLPGAREIRRVGERLASVADDRTAVLALHGMLDGAAQDAAIAPSAPDCRKVVLSTSIAETSLTIDGVRVVVDAGLTRVAHFSPRTGMSRLETSRVSRAAADQRRGRAGRTEPGVCYRLWAEADDATLAAASAPEIANADLASVILDLAAAGLRAPEDLAWLDAPPPPALAQARELLRELGALDGEGRATAHGRRMAELGLHPRLAHLALLARGRGLGALAADLVALLGERDVARAGAASAGGVDVDLRPRVDALRGSQRDLDVDRGAIRRARAEADEWRRRLRVPPGERADSAPTGWCVALAYPDRIAQRRAGQVGRFLLASGRGASLDPAQPLAHAPYLAVAEIDDTGAEGRIRLAAPIDEGELRALAGERVTTAIEVTWDDEVRGVVAREVERYGALVLASRPTSRVDLEAVRAAWLARIARQGIASLPWTDAARRLRERLRFLGTVDAESWPDVSDEALAARLGEWLGPRLDGVRREADLARVDLAGAVLSLVDGRRRAQLAELAPERFEAPTGSSIAIDYGDPSAPAVAIRLQELFGCTDSPRLAGGRVPLTFRLLSPAHRPVQVTRDLAGFWRGSYAEVRRELRGRYPKHAWPENPLEAAPTRGARRRI